MMCSSPWGALVALCWISSTMSVTLCPVPLNTVLRCSFRSCTEQRSPIPWPADSTVANTDHAQLSSLPQGLPAYSCSALLWGLQVSFLQSSFLAICPQPAGLGYPLQVWDSDSLFLLRPAEIPWVAALSSRISADVPNLGLSVKLFCTEIINGDWAVMEDIEQYWDILSRSNTSDWPPTGLHTSGHSCLSSVMQPDPTLLRDHPFRLYTSNLAARMCETLASAMLLTT